MNKKILKYSLTFVVVAGVAYLFSNRLSTSWDSVQASVNFELNPLSLVSLVFMTSAVLVSGLMWRSVLHEINSSTVDKEITPTEGMRVHVGAWLLKYIPGQIGSIAYKVSWGAKKGYKKTNVALSFVYENLFLTIVSLLPTSLILLLTGNLEPGINIVLVAILIGSTILLFSRPIMKRFIDFTAKRAKIDYSKIKLISTKKVISFSMLYGIPRIVNGFGFVAVAASILSISAGDVLPLIAAYTLAGIIGIYAVFVPSGLGVREAMIVVFAAGVLGAEEAIVLSVVARFYATVTDGILAIIYSSMTGRKRIKA